MSQHRELDYFKRGVELSYHAMEQGNDGFACVLVGPDGSILLEQENEAKTLGDVTAHDAILLVRAAVKKYDSDFLKDCSIYATMEPCIMCMGAVYWSGIGTVKFAVSEEEYSAMRGGGGLDLHSKEFARRSPRPIQVCGPFPEAHDMVIQVIQEHIRRKTAVKT